MGFCLLNTVAVAAAYARRKHGAERVAVIDGDGRLLFSDFHLDADSLAAEVVRIDGERAVASE